MEWMKATRLGADAQEGRPERSFAEAREQASRPRRISWHAPRCSKGAGAEVPHASKTHCYFRERDPAWGRPIIVPTGQR